MFTSKMNLLSLLSVIVLLLFAAPVMDGVLTIFQKDYFGETSRFEAVVYAGHPENPNVDDEHTHSDKTWTEKCGRWIAKAKKFCTDEKSDRQFRMYPLSWYNYKG